MRYIKYTGNNGFQVYGFVKDNSNKLERWKMRFDGYSSKRGMRIYSINTGHSKTICENEYLYIDELDLYNNRFKVCKNHPLLLLIKVSFGKLIRMFNTNTYINQINWVLNND